MEENSLMVILGATASGKTKLAIEVARKLNGEIISADSRQVFRGMNIGTGKDLHDFTIGGKTIPYHLINILQAGEQYNVDAFKNDFHQSYYKIIQRGNLPILCGGTGMYIHSLFQNQQFTAVPSNLDLRLQLQNFTKDELLTKIKSYNIEHTKHIDLSSTKRLIRGIEVADYLINNNLEETQLPSIKPLVIGLKNEIQNTRKNILDRLEKRLNNGLIEEVELLLANGLSHEKLIFYGLEYKFISNYLNGMINYDELKLKLGIAICQFAKRQNTFFRKMEKDGVKIFWLNASNTTDLLVNEVLELAQNEDNCQL